MFQIWSLWCLHTVSTSLMPAMGREEAALSLGPRAGEAPSLSPDFLVYEAMQ